MDSSEEDSEDVPTAFMVGTSQVETQTNQDTKTILCNLPALSPKTSDSAKEKGILFTKRLLETSSEDEVKKQEMAKILVKDSESDMDQIRLVSETNDEKDSFSDGDIVMSQSASDANITVICKTKSTADKNTDQASTSGITSSPVVIANTFQSQGFDLVPSSQEDMFLVKDTCDDEEITPIKNSQNFHSLQFSGEPMIVPETLDHNLGDSPDIIMSTPRIIPNSPTDGSLIEDDDKKEDHYDPTAIATLNEQVKESVNIGNDSKPEDSQDLALRLSPSQPYHYGESPCQSLKYDEEINIENKKATNSPQSESFHLSIPSDGVLLHPTTTDSRHGTGTDNSTSPDTNKTSPSSQEGGIGKHASLDIGQIGTQSENNSDTSFHLNVPIMSGVDNINDDTNQQNVFNLAKTGSKRPKPVSSFIEESSEDVFAFEKRRKITKDDDVKGEDVPEPMVVEDQESVDPNAETQPSNDDCSSVTGEKQSVLLNEDTQLYEHDLQTKHSTSVEIIEADEVAILIKKPSVIVLDSEETENEQMDNTKYTSLLEKTTSEDKQSKAAEEVTDVVQPGDMPPHQNIEPASQCSEEILQSQSLNKMNEESKEQSASLGSQSKPAQSSQNKQSSLSKADSETSQSSPAKPSSQTRPSSQVKAASQSEHSLHTTPASQAKSNSQQNQNRQIQASSAEGLQVDKESTPKQTVESEQRSPASSQPKHSLHTEQVSILKQSSQSKSPTKQSSQNKSAVLEKASSSQQLEKEASVEEHVHFQMDENISGDKVASKTAGDVSKAAEDVPKTAGDVSKAAGDVSKAAGDASKAAGDVSKVAVHVSKAAGDASKAPEDVPADPYLFHGTQSQGLLGTTVSVTTGTTHPDQSSKQTSKSPKALSGKKLKKLPAKRILPQKTQTIIETRSSTDDQQIGLSRQATLRRKRTSSSKKQSKTRDEFIRPVEPVTTPLRSRTEARSSRDTPSSVHSQHGESSRPQSQRRMEFQEFTEAIESTLQKSSSSSLSSQEELEYHEVTTQYKVVDITITNKHGDILYNKTKKEREEPVVVKRKISKEEVHQFESPRSLSTCTLSSGELGDIESLSRSSGSKNSLPQSLDKTSPSLDVLTPSLQKSKSDSSQTTHIAASSIHSDIANTANTPNESPIDNAEMGAHTGGVEISDVIFTSPETSDTAKKQSGVPQTAKSTSPLVRKQAADSSSQDTSEIECAQRPSAAAKVPDVPSFDESGGFSVRGGTTSVHSSSSGRKEDISTTPTGRSSKKKTGTGRGKQSTKSKSKKHNSSTSTTTTTDTSKTSPEIPMIGGNNDTASTSTMSTKPTYYASTLTKGSAVMAKWKDGYYYPGTIKQVQSERVKISFDDGDIKFVNNSNILLVKQLPIGQSVMVLSNDGYFDTGMILGHMTSDSDDSILYQVEKDNGEKHRFSHSQVILSEDQAACLMSDEELRICQPGGSHVSTHINPANVSLDNLVEGKRTRSAKKEMPEPTETKRLGRKRKAGESGPMATSTPTPKGKRLQTEKAQQSSSTTSNLLDSPSTSGTRHSPRKVRIGLFDDTTKTVELFKNMAFILTHGVKTKEQKREEKKQLRDSDISTEESSAEEEELHPFNKHQLISLIVEGGGVILNEFDQEKINQYEYCFLISDSHHRTVKYMQALAAGLPCVSHLWIIFSSSQGKLLDNKSYILPAGINIEKRKLCEWNSRGSCLTGLNVMVNSSNKEFVSAWSSVLNISRCHLITKLPTAKSKSKLDVIITDNSCSNTVLKKAEQLTVPIVSTEWVIQCLITSHIVNYTGHPKYRHDYYDK